MRRKVINFLSVFLLIAALAVTVVFLAGSCGGDQPEGDAGVQTETAE